MIKVFEAFAGVGSQRMALKNLGIPHEVVAISEIDKFAIASYEAIHGKVNNLGDISKLEEKDIPYHDLFTYSFPCQDISLAGKQGGFEKGSGTRSSLLWECNRVIESKKPKYLLLENVKNLVGKKFKPDFDEWLNHLESLGYKNYWQVLNAKDYGIPQNRERVFVVSILGEHEPYVFPEPVELELKLKDVLESEVDEKYYLSKERVDRLTLNLDKVTANKDLQVVGNTSATGYNKSNVYHENGISPTLAARDYKGPNQVLIKNATKKGYLEATDGEKIIIDDTTGFEKEARVYEDYSPSLRASRSGLKTMSGQDFRIRKLTPLEYWRLMGFKDLHFYKAQKVNSNSQLYKQAGNSIVVPVLEGIFRKLI